MTSDDLFDTPKQQHPLHLVTRENAARALPHITCPKCRVVGGLATFNKGPHVGVTCTACGRESPFGGYWLGR